MKSGEAPWQQGGAPSVGEEAEMADADEALGEQVNWRLLALLAGGCEAVSEAHSGIGWASHAYDSLGRYGFVRQLEGL